MYGRQARIATARRIRPAESPGERAGAGRVREPERVWVTGTSLAARRAPRLTLPDDPPPPRGGGAVLPWVKDVASRG
ncbi:hypothetical protein SSPO_073870 [Streptomyces antimycoticus]|uniref:Uncharacterized protein n=1 Tax=Streptomyces antimycoticus TaxID=68175 RepID=A0A499V6R0_9ACTN|nr:hypothetical protein SSPO_073870 [Streptomyces antimycoticus]